MDYAERAAAGTAESEQRTVGRSGMTAVEVDGGYWMLMHARYGVLLRDLGWFDSRAAAEAKAQELERVFGTSRRTILHGFDAATFN
jgi:hypothetical protein